MFMILEYLISIALGGILLATCFDEDFAFHASSDKKPYIYPVILIRLTVFTQFAKFVSDPCPAGFRRATPATANSAAIHATQTRTFLGWRRITMRYVASAITGPSPDALDAVLEISPLVIVATLILKKNHRRFLANQRIL